MSDKKQNSLKNFANGPHFEPVRAFMMQEVDRFLSDSSNLDLSREALGDRAAQFILFKQHIESRFNELENLTQEEAEKEWTAE